MASDKVTVSVGDGFFDCYLALPPSGNGPGLMLIPEIFGVNAHIRDVADRWAKEGYVVMAPDLFWRMKPNLELGYEGADFDQALQYFQNFDEEKGIQDLKEAAIVLRDLKQCTGRVGAIGFCLGGELVFRLAAHFNLNCAVSYYGVYIEKHLEEAERIKCQTIMHFAELDHFVPQETVKLIEESLASKANFKIFIYPGVDHGFNCDVRASYNKEAAQLAHERSLDLMNKSLKS